jgi:hypothetical protein
MMEDIIVYIVIISFAFWAGWKVRGLIMLAAMSENPEKIIKMLKEVEKINNGEIKESAGAGNIKVEVEPEKVGAVWYAYAKETGQFLAQGPTLEDAIRLASIRFPNKTFWCETAESNLTKQA